jgi:hypothetical protein
VNREDGGVKPPLLELAGKLALHERKKERREKSTEEEPQALRTYRQFLRGREFAKS